MVEEEGDGVTVTQTKKIRRRKTLLQLAVERHMRAATTAAEKRIATTVALMVFAAPRKNHLGFSPVADLLVAAKRAYQGRRCDDARRAALAALGLIELSAADLESDDDEQG